MLLTKRTSFFVPTYPPCIGQAYRFSNSPLRRNILVVAKNPSKSFTKRTYATQRHDFGGSATTNNSGGGGIPLGQIHLGSAKVPPPKGIAIKDDITKTWKELSLPQKIVRTGTQTTNFAVVIIAVGVLV